MRGDIPHYPEEILNYIAGIPSLSSRSQSVEQAKATPAIHPTLTMSNLVNCSSIPQHCQAASQTKNPSIIQSQGTHMN